MRAEAVATSGRPLTIRGCGWVEFEKSDDDEHVAPERGQRSLEDEASRYIAAMMGSAATLVEGARKYIEKDVAVCAEVAAELGADLGSVLTVAQEI